MLKGKYPVRGTYRSKETRQKLQCCSSLLLPGQGSSVLHRELLTLTGSDMEGYTDSGRSSYTHTAYNMSIAAAPTRRVPERESIS